MGAFEAPDPHVFVHFVKSLRTYNCKIFHYTFLSKYPMEFQDFFSLCQIQNPIWLQLNYRKLGPPEVTLLSDPCIIKLKKKKKHTFMCDMLL